MILGRSQHPASACFDEINTAVEALTDRVVCFNAYAFPSDVPPGCIVYNFENAGQITNPRTTWPDHELWDFSASNAAKYGATHCPIGFHPTMQRFTRSLTLDIDIVFTGCMNPRRADVLQALADRGLTVTHIGPGGPHGAERDAVLARAKLALNMLFYEDGTFPVLRTAHLVANRVPVLNESAPEIPAWAGQRVLYGDLVEYARELVALTDRERGKHASAALAMFADAPMVLPS